MVPPSFPLFLVEPSINFTQLVVRQTIILMFILYDVYDDEFLEISHRDNIYQTHDPCMRELLKCGWDPNLFHLH